MKDLELYTDFVDYPKDCKRIQLLLQEKGYNSTLEQCEKLWLQVSNNVGAGWLFLDDTEESLWNTVKPYIKN